MDPTAPAPVAPGAQDRRFDALDVTRGMALAAMAGYHALWDLGYLSLTPQSYALTPPGRVAAQVIAGSFLVLVGTGLVLMNRGGLRWRAILRRFLRVGGAALAITAATFVAFPQSYIFFGILHCIALASLIALPALSVPVPVAVGLALAAAAMPRLVSGGVFDMPALAFLGLGTGIPETNDFVPLLPWLGAVLAGLAAARLGARSALVGRIGAWRARGRIARLAAFAGRHSLAVYLIHQPVLLALLGAVVAVTGPHPRAGIAEFRVLYVANCTRTGGDPALCRAAGRCTADALRREGLWATTERRFTAEERARAQVLSQDCYDGAETRAAAP